MRPVGTAVVLVMWGGYASAQAVGDDPTAAAGIAIDVPIMEMEVRRVAPR